MDDKKKNEIWVLGDKRVRRGDVVDYYIRNMPEVPSGPVAIIYYYPKGPEWRRRHPSGELIRISKYDDPNSKDSLLFHILKRGVEFHITYGPQTSEIVLDVDPGDDVDETALKKATKALSDAMRARGLDVEVIYTGGRGFHVVGKLPGSKTISIDRARDIAKEIGVSVSATTDLPIRVGGLGPPRKNEIHVDLSPMKNMGTRRAPGSINVRTGRLSVKLSPDDIDSFDISQTDLDKILKSVV